MKKKWREILDQWRKETRYPGSIPKEQFPHLLDRLWRGIGPNVAENLKSGFRGLEEVLKRILGGINDAEVERVLDNSLIDLLKEHRGTGTEGKRKRGRKVDPGTDAFRTVAVFEKPSAVSEKSPTTADEPGLSTSAPMRKSKLGGKANSSQCRINWKDYKGAIDWIQCTKCLAWICGPCNKDSKDPFFVCDRCDDSEDCESPFDDSVADKDFQPDD
ncbi:hypothetical protein MML48_5g00008306 [Holotrichia oblita]|uniref:Uncharacterized protein n=1 Tax=Holotrichia oblita TaxID=644536 RepID=A0ACB9T1J3_HOLOL|nr:hypothetical protein MML48_5g00008306 [Holotrichia oblita]